MGKAKGESRGLAYLKQVRPQAMEHLLQFFAESARHLEPKTRFLISIVTKVIGSSPRGVEQYVKRALQEGASPAEIIDAVLCAYPCAGLARVVDAVDVILDLGLPGFEALVGPPGPAVPAAPPAASPASAHDAGLRWVRVATLEELPAGGALHVVAGRRQVALFNVAGKVSAIDHHCPHKGGPLAHGLLRENVVTCPLHNWMFNVESGECVNRPGARVATYPVRVSGEGAVELLLPGAG